MLNWLKIDNLALIEHADVEFTKGFNVVTGETGAGKSILLGTIALLLGGRADRGAIRTGCDRCEVACSITVPPGLTGEVAAFLEESGLTFDPANPEIFLRRVLTRSSVRNYLNDSAVAASTLKNLGEILIDIHSANEHHSLVSRARQLRLLDRFADLEEPLSRCRLAFEQLRQLEVKQYEALERIPDAREAHELQLTCDDIGRVAPEPGEDAAVAARHQLAGNSRRILELASRSSAILDGSENSVADQLAEVYREISELERLDPAGAASLLEQAALLTDGMRSLAAELSDYAAKLEMDEEAFAKLEERLSALFTLKRRYGPGLEDVLKAYADAQERLTLYQQADSLRRKFAVEIAAAKEALQKIAEELSGRRREAAVRLCAAVREKLAKLGFKKTAMDLRFTEVEAGADGMDEVELYFSANPGEAPRPLREVASSGELARLMLALKAVLAGADATPVLVFDEIDVNLGGETAHEVGKELVRLAEQHQVLCISHLAQVAGRAHAHYVVCKNVHCEHASSRIERLDEEHRLRELARLLGGGAAALAHAGDLSAELQREFERSREKAGDLL